MPKVQLWRWNLLLQIQIFQGTNGRYISQDTFLYCNVHDWKYWHFTIIIRFHHTNSSYLKVCGWQKIFCILQGLKTPGNLMKLCCCMSSLADTGSSKCIFALWELPQRPFQSCTWLWVCLCTGRFYWIVHKELHCIKVYMTIKSHWTNVSLWCFILNLYILCTSWSHIWVVIKYHITISLVTNSWILTFKSSGSHESRVRERTLEKWTPRLLDVENKWS